MHRAGSFIVPVALQMPDPTNMEAWSDLRSWLKLSFGLRLGQHVDLRSPACRRVARLFSSFPVSSLKKGHMQKS
jgi:hypothetical protein